MVGGDTELQARPGRAVVPSQRRPGHQSGALRRLRDILDALDGPKPLVALSAPTYRLHRLHGKRAGEWSVWVSRGWRVTFRMDGEDVRAVRYENYHH